MCDLCKLPYVSLGGAEHMLVFVDQYSKCMAVFPVSNKAHARDTVEEFVTIRHNALDVRIQTIHSEKEFKNDRIDAY